MRLPCVLWGCFLALAGGAGSVFAAGATALQEAKLLAGDAAPGDRFGIAVAVDRNTAVIGAPEDEDNGVRSGSAYVFVLTNDTWVQQAKLLPPDATEDHGFGVRVDVDGDTAIVGANLDDDTGFNAGAAYVFVRTGEVWTLEAKLLASDGNPGDQFSRVSLDGDTAVIGAGLSENPGTSSGSAYVFVRTNGNWTQQAKLLPEDPDTGDFFGLNTAVHGDTALIAADRDDDNGDNAGAAYVFVRTNGDWTQQDKLLAQDGADNDLFGVALSLDEDTAVIGAMHDDANGNNSGSVYVFTRDNGVWAQEAKLLADDAASSRFLGRDVAVHGNVVVGGAVGSADNGVFAGAAYLFTRGGQGWSQQAKMLAGDGAAGDLLGRGAAVHGSTAVIGASQFDPADPDSAGPGSAYVFRILPADKVPALGGWGMALLLLVVLGAGRHLVGRP